MAIIERSVSRGQFLAMTGAAALAMGVPAARAATISTKPIPKSKNGEQLPVIGIGTNRYGRPAANAEETARRTAVMKALLDVLQKPFDYERDLPEFSTPAPTGEQRYLTYCGT